MTVIHILPPSRDPVLLSRACDALGRSIEAGEDLGDRSHHIRVLAASLAMLLGDARRQIGLIRDRPPVPETDVEGIARMFDTLVDALAKCSAAIERACLTRGIEGHGRLS